MDAQTCEIDIGTPPSGTVQAEDGSIKVTSKNVEFSRDFQEYEDDEGCTYAITGRNPKAQIDLEGELITSTGLADMHVGQTLGDLTLTLANYASEQRGFDPADGVIYLESATDSSTEDEAPTTSMTFQHRPKVTVAAS